MLAHDDVSNEFVSYSERSAAVGIVAVGRLGRLLCLVAALETGPLHFPAPFLFIFIFGQVEMWHDKKVEWSFEGCSLHFVVKAKSICCTHLGNVIALNSFNNLSL
jgi:hypothetical protein